MEEIEASSKRFSELSDRHGEQPEPKDDEKP